MDKKHYTGKNKYYRAPKPSSGKDNIARPIYKEKNLGPLHGTSNTNTGKIIKKGIVRDKHGH